MAFKPDPLLDLDLIEEDSYVDDTYAIRQNPQLPPSRGNQRHQQCNHNPVTPSPNYFWQETIDPVATLSMTPYGRGSGRNLIQPSKDLSTLRDDTDITRPQNISSPSNQALDVIHVDRRFSYSETEVPDNPLTKTVPEDMLGDSLKRTSSPWNALSAQESRTRVAANEFGQIRQSTEYPNVHTNQYWYNQHVAPRVSSVANGRPLNGLNGLYAITPDNASEARPRGGRQRGMNLSQESVNNVRAIRQIGACLRCQALKEKCSAGMPCRNCGSHAGRKWDGCVRCFNDLGYVFKPELMADRLRKPSLTQFMVGHIHPSPRQSVQFDMPLWFGFGKTFWGFRGAEYKPTVAETMYSVVLPTDRDPESPQQLYSLPIYPVNSDSLEVQRQVWQWLRETLKSKESMEDWLSVCFRDQNVEWIKELLRAAWQYSMKSWEESRVNSNQVEDEHHLSESLSHAWMMALLTTILSLLITIPHDARHHILNQLQWRQSSLANSLFPSPSSPSSASSSLLFTSRPVNKCVKSLLFNLYEKLVAKVMGTLESFRKTRLKNISEGHLVHIHCITILIVVVTFQLQASLMDNFRLAEQENLWKDTFHYIHEVEKAFKNTVLYVRHINKEWLRKNPNSDALQLRKLLERIQDIIREHHEDISRHRTSKLEALLHPDLAFDSPNMKRVFAFYFDLDATDNRAQAPR